MVGVRFIAPKKLMLYRRGIYTIQKKTGRSILDIVRSSNIILPYNKKSKEEDYALQFKKVVEKLNLSTDEGYVYPFDPMTCRMRNLDVLYICSNTVDYNMVLNTNIQHLSSLLGRESDSLFCRTEISILNSITLLVDRIMQKLPPTKRGLVLKEYFENLKSKNCQTLDEAIQRILFFNALFWQMDHWHVGLGRLDLILYPFYDHDIKNGVISQEEAKNMLRQLVIVLGKDTRSKSLTLIGDTGQYILLGGVDKDGNVVDNDLTKIFIEIFTELRTPDPKLILRVSSQTSDSTWKNAMKCIVTGCGSPLIMNESLVMDSLIRFGYKKADVWNMGTSACWEPLIIGKSFDQNNPLSSITIIKALNDAVMKANDDCSYDELLNLFKEESRTLIKNSIHNIDFDVSPLYSLFFDSCIARKRDYTRGGAEYAYHGVQIVSFPNLVNAILNIKRYVYDEGLIALSQCKQVLVDDFANQSDIRELLLSNSLKYGSTDKAVVTTTNEMIEFLSEEVANYSINGEKLKMGFSSPQYIINKGQVRTSLDGRNNYAPFAVHISPVSANIDISEILDFASQLNYEGNRINGNVVDFILPSSYVKQQDKLISLLRNACDKGLFEIQLNVLDKATLIDAKVHPEKYPNLIVRVWGFSAYFNDLPEEYKDNLIQRAQTYEA